MRLPITIGKDIERTIANSWDDLTVREFFLLKEWADSGTNDMNILLAILLDIEEETVKKLSAFDIKTIVEPSIKFLKVKWDMSRIFTPAVVHIERQLASIPRDLNLMTFGQYASIESYIKDLAKLNESTEKDRERMCSILTIVLFKQLFPSEEFTQEAVVAKRSMIMSMNYAEAWAVEVFFWKKWQSSSRRGRNGFTRLLRMTSDKLKRNVSGYLESSRRSMPSQKETS